MTLYKDVIAELMGERAVVASPEKMVPSPANVALLGMEKALDEISRNAGILYDRQVVEACAKVFREQDFRFDGEAVPGAETPSI